MTSTFKNMEKMAASDQALLEALAAAAADVNSGKYALNIPVTSSPGLSPLKLQGSMRMKRRRTSRVHAP